MRDTVDRFLGYFLSFLLLLITLTVLYGVFTRYAIGQQASWTEELARFLLIWIGILGAAWVSGQRGHLAISLLPDALPLAKRQHLQSAIDLLVLFFSVGVFIVGGTRLLYITYQLNQFSAALQLPMALVYAVLPLSGLLIIFFKLNDLLNPERWK